MKSPRELRLALFEFISNEIDTTWDRKTLSDDVLTLEAMIAIMRDNNDISITTSKDIRDRKNDLLGKLS